MARSRVYYLDVLRVIACLSVIMIHVSCRYVDGNYQTGEFWLGNILDSLSRIGVPLFVMISGSLLLDEKYEFSISKIKKHILKMVYFFIFWSSIYCLIFQIFRPVFVLHQALSVKAIIGNLIRGYPHLWFVYMIVGLYLIVPLLRLWVKEDNVKAVRYYIVLAFVFSILFPQLIELMTYYAPAFSAPSVIRSYIGLEYVGGYTVYFILGWYLNKYDVCNGKIVFSLGLLSIIFEVLMTYCLSVRFGRPIQMYDYLSANVFLQTVMVFVFTKKHVSEKQTRFVNLISKYSLGIYAIHNVFVFFLYEVMINGLGISTAIVDIPVVYLLSLPGSLCFSILLSKVDCLKKFVM